MTPCAWSGNNLPQLQAVTSWCQLAWGPLVSRTPFVGLQDVGTTACGVGGIGGLDVASFQVGVRSRLCTEQVVALSQDADSGQTHAHCGTSPCMLHSTWLNIMVPCKTMHDHA